MPRKKSEDFYKLHGFTANYDRGKYTAICNICHRVLQNTALSRLLLHRTTCDNQRRKDEQDLADRHQVLKMSVANEADLGSDTEGKEIIVKIQQILDAANDGNFDKTESTVLLKKEMNKSTDQDQEAEQHMEYEIVTPDYADDSKEHQLEDSANGSTMHLEAARPRNNLAALRAEKTRAEIRHYQSKTKFLKTETENLKLERTLALLRIQKLRLEINALRA